MLGLFALCLLSNFTFFDKRKISFPGDHGYVLGSAALGLPLLFPGPQVVFV